MASKCIGDCLNMKSHAVCVRPGTTYANLHKWPVAEVEFVRSISRGGSQRRSTAVDSISCRQMYLRSYTFSKKEDNEQDGKGQDDGNVANDQRGRSVMGEGKKAAKKSMRTSKPSFVVRFLSKCLSCTSSNKVNVDP